MSQSKAKKIEFNTFIETQNSERQDYKSQETYQKKTNVKTVLSATVKGYIFLTIFACCVPVLVYYFVVDRGTFETRDAFTCLVNPAFRVPCGRENITSNRCLASHCCFDTAGNNCYHYLPSRYSYDYDPSTNQFVAAQTSTPLGQPSVSKMALAVRELASDRVAVVLHAADQAIENQLLADVQKDYSVELADQKLIVEVTRLGNGDALLSTAKGPLIVSQDYWEWSLHLGSERLFGPGGSLVRAADNQTLTRVFYKNANDHYAEPVFWSYKNGMFHGISVKHDGPLEVTVLPSNLIVLRGLTGEKVEVELSLGPTPELLHDQQVSTGKTPPAWALDTQVCRKGEDTDLQTILSDYSPSSHAVSDCIHENLFVALMNDSGANTQQLSPILSQLKRSGVKFLLAVPPQVPFQSVLFERVINSSSDVFYRRNGAIYNGTYLGQAVAYPDFSSSNVSAYLDEFANYLSLYLNVTDIDGFILHDNWPVDESYVANTNNSNFTYFPQHLRDAMSHTLPWDSLGSNSTQHIKTHNSYGANQITAFETYFGSLVPDSVIESASKFYRQDAISSVDNVDASWDNMRRFLDGLLFSSISGNHLVNVPVCGDTSIFNASSQETLCLRWYLIAATLPTLKMSSRRPYREPQDLDSAFAQTNSQRAIARRKSLLAHYYTLVSRNRSVVRPMYYDHHGCDATFALDHQYTVGGDMLTAHPFSSGTKRLGVFLPPKTGVWYELWAGNMYNATDNSTVGVDLVETDLVIFLAQGSVLPLKVNNTLNLIVALNCTENCYAKGELLEINYLQISANDTSVTISDLPSMENCNIDLGYVKVYSYENHTGNSQYFTLNENLCRNQTNLVVNYENVKENVTVSDA